MKNLNRLRNVLLFFLVSFSLSTISFAQGIDLDDGIKVGNSTSTTNGTIRYTGTDFEGYSGGSWNSLTGGGGGSSIWTLNGNSPRYDMTGPIFCEMNSTNSGNVGYRFMGAGSQRAMIWYENSSGDLIFTNNSGSTRHLVIDGATKNVGIGTASPDETLDVEFTGSNGVKIDGNNTGDARLWITNDMGNHFLFDDSSDGNDLKLQFANDFDIDAGAGNTKLSINGTSGDVSITNELGVGQLLTANQDIELRGTDPRIDFWNPSPPGTGCSILYDENSSSGGNGGDLRFINYQIVGEIEFITSTSNLNMRMNDTNTYSYEDFSPWLHKGNDLGLNGKAWDDVYADDYINQGSSSFNDRTVTEEILNYPPVDKKPGDFDYMTERGDIESDPAFLPPSLHANNGILIDEMANYNYKANYEQQVQINELKELVKQLQAEIAELKSN